MLDAIGMTLGYIKYIVELLGYWGIGIGMFLESACIPVPSELVLPLAGMMVSDGKLTMLGANVVVTVGSMLGSIAAYIIGCYGGRPFIMKHGSRFFISNNHFELAERTFNKYGAFAVLFGRLLPVIRTFISLPAGIAKLGMKKFLTFSLIGMIPWNFILIYLGFKFNESYDAIIEPIYKRFEHIVILLIVLIVVAVLVRTIFMHKKDKWLKSD